MLKNNVTVVGEMHQDVFYRNDAYTTLAKMLSVQLKKEDISKYDEKSLEKVILKIIDNSPKKIGSESYTKRGGNGNNSTTMLHRLEIPTQLMTTIGQGANWLKDDLKSMGIDTSTVYQVESLPPISTIIEDPNITKIFIAPNLKKNMNFDKVNISDDAFQSSKIVFFTPIADKYVKVLKQVENLNLITAITIETQKIQTYDQLEAICQVKSNILFANLNDAAQILSIETNIKDESVLLERLSKVDKIFHKYADIRIFTLGKYGSWICLENEPAINIPVIPIKVINRTGAGDTFAAGFIAYLFKHIKDQKEFINLPSDKKKDLLTLCVKYATAAATLKVSTGNAPSQQDVDELFAKNL
jgi:sugar/nucleoside kinase (ribokinase family)